MRAIMTVAELLKESREWRRFFKSCCQTSALRLRSRAWQFRDELRDRGHALSLEEAEDALFDLAQRLLPATPAAEWPAWAKLVCEDALARLQEHYAVLSPEEKETLDLSRAWKQNEHIVTASLAEDRAAMRKAIRAYEQEALASFKSIRAAAKPSSRDHAYMEDRGHDDASKDDGVVPMPTGTATHDVVSRKRDKGGLMPLTTAQIYAKLGIEEGQPLYLLALCSDEDGSLQGVGATFPDWKDGEELPTEHGRVLYAFTSPERAKEFAKKTSWQDPDPAYPEVLYAWWDWGAQPDYEAPAHVEPKAADLRDIVYVVAYFSHHHTLAIDAGPIGEGLYIPLEDLGWSRELVEVYRAFPAATHIDRFFAETAEDAEKDFREGRAVDNHGIFHLPAHLFEGAHEDPS